MFRLPKLENEHDIESFERAIRAPVPGSAEEEKRFELLKKRLEDLYRYVFPDPRSHRTVVVVPSLSMDEVVLSRLDGIRHYEERMLCLLLLLRLPRTNVIYLTSEPISPHIVDYYLNLLPGVPTSHARKRLTLLSCYDDSIVPLTRKILDRPRLVRRIRDAIPDTQVAHLTCFNSTALERTLAVRLEIPLYGCDPRLTRHGSKSGSRRIFREAGISIPEGLEDLKSTTDLIEALDELKGRSPRLRKAVIKLDEGASGEGNAVFSFDEVPEGRSRKKWIAGNMRKCVTLEAKDETWSHFKTTFNAMGGIVENFIDGRRKRSPSMQGRIDPLGNVSIVSTHDQVLGGPSGQIFLGCMFPADHAYGDEIQRAGLEVGHILRDKGIVGRYGVDFVSVRRSGSWKHYAIEINIRKGGTTHPYLMLQFLTDGYYNPDTGQYSTKSGLTRYYYASDNVCSPSYRGLTPEDLIDIVVDHGLHFNGATQTGSVFHLIGALSQHGKLGLSCIADSRQHAYEMYEKTIHVLGLEAEAQEQVRRLSSKDRFEL